MRPERARKMVAKIWSTPARSVVSVNFEQLLTPILYISVIIVCCVRPSKPSAPSPPWPPCLCLARGFAPARALLPGRGPWPACAAVARARFAPGPQPVAGLCRPLSQNRGGRPAATLPLVAVGGPSGQPNWCCRYISCLKFPFRPYCFIILRDGHVFTIQPLLLRYGSRVAQALTAYNALYRSIIR